MDLIIFIGRKVKVTLNNSQKYYYVGKVTDADENSIDMIDMKNNHVSLTKESILTIQEVGY